MTAHPIPPSPTSPTAARPSPVLGILLVVPMLLATLACIGWPSMDALVRAVSVTEGPLGREMGPASWGNVLADAGGLAIAGLAQTLPAVIVGTLVAIPIAQALAVGAIAARIATAALMLASMPVAAATWWALGPGEIGPAGAVGVTTAALLPTVAGIAGVVLVPVVRAGLRPLRSLLAAVAVGAAAAALALQSPISSVFAGGTAQTLPAVSFETAFQRLELADGAACDLLVLVSLGVLGIAVVVLLAVLRPAIVVVPVGGGRPLAATIGALVAGVLALGAIGMPVLLAAGADGLGPAADPLVPAALGTWVPALVGAAVATALAMAAAIGIGWLRPLGRHSLWLLVPFAPALLVAAAPLVASTYLERIALEVGLLPLLPTIVVSVPLLVGLTLLASGMRRVDRLDVRTLAWAGLVAFAAMAAVSAQAVQPARVLATIEQSSIVLQLQSIAVLAGSGGAVGIVALATTLPVAVLLAPLVVLGLGALRGSTLVVGDEPLPAAPASQLSQTWAAQPAAGPVVPQPGAPVMPPPVPGTQVSPPGWPPPVAPPQP